MSKVFTNVLIITGGGPDGATRVLSLFIYQTGFQFFKMGLATRGVDLPAAGHDGVHADPAAAVPGGAPWLAGSTAVSPLVRWLGFLLVLAGAVVMLMPVLWMVSTSLKPLNRVFELPIQWIPRPPKWDNYPAAWNRFDFCRYFVNSFIVSISGHGPERAAGRLRRLQPGQVPLLRPAGRSSSPSSAR